MIYLFITLSLLTFVAGQLLLKVAFNRLEEPEAESPIPQRTAVKWIFAASIFSMALSFFFDLGLKQKMDLSYLFPFQGLSILVVAFGSVFFLKERVSRSLIIGMLFITAGVILVSMT